MKQTRYAIQDDDRIRLLMSRSSLWVISVDRAVEDDLRAISTDVAIDASCDSMYVADSA